MDYIGYINSKASEYKEYLLNELRKNVAPANLVNLVFFPLSKSIEEWLKEMDVESFYEYGFKGNSFINRIGTREEVDEIPFLKNTYTSFDRYTFFSNFKANSYQEAQQKFPSAYHFVRKDFLKKLDKIILDKLKDYKTESENIHLHTKRVSKFVDLTINTDREYFELQGISGYTFPSLIINVRDEGCINFGSIDVRNLLFLPGNSFLFFYADSHNYSVDRNLGLKDIKRKDDEPAIYFLEEEQKYLISNSLDAIDQYNKYIQIVLELSFHYFDVFEKWLTRLLAAKQD